jgi:hypothetical protein
MPWAFLKTCCTSLKKWITMIWIRILNKIFRGNLSRFIFMQKELYLLRQFRDPS